MRKIIILLFLAIVLKATPPDSIEFDHYNGYSVAELECRLNQMDYYEGKLYLTYARSIPGHPEYDHYIVKFTDNQETHTVKHIRHDAKTTLTISNLKDSYVISYLDLYYENGYKNGVYSDVYRISDDYYFHQGLEKYLNQCLPNYKEPGGAYYHFSEFDPLRKSVFCDSDQWRKASSESHGQHHGISQRKKRDFLLSENNKYLYLNDYYYGYRKYEYSEQNEAMLSQIKLYKNLDTINLFYNKKKIVDPCVPYHKYPPNFGFKIVDPAFSPDEKYFAAHVDSTDSLVYYDLESQTEPMYIKAKNISKIKCFSPDSKHLIMLNNNRIYLYDPSNAERIDSLDFDFEHEISKLDVSPENNTLAVLTQKEKSFWKYRNITDHRLYIFDWNEVFNVKSNVDGGIIINEISVSPNPAGKMITINADVAFNGSTVCKIYGFDGNLVKKLILEGQRTKVNVSNFDKGVYVVHIIDKHGLRTAKFLKY